MFMMPLLSLVSGLGILRREDPWGVLSVTTGTPTFLKPSATYSSLWAQRVQKELRYYLITFTFREIGSEMGRCAIDLELLRRRFLFSAVDKSQV